MIVASRSFHFVAMILIALSGVSDVIRPRAVRVLPAGDSITQGAYGAGQNGAGGYRTPLWHQLATSGHPVEFVGTEASGPATIDRDHAGWNGISIAEITRRLAYVLKWQQPDIVLLHIGTNDVIADAAPDLVESRLATLLDKIFEQAPHTQLLVSSLIRVRTPNDYGVRSECIAEVNKRIRRLVADLASHGKPVQLVDMHAHAVRTPADFHKDGLHPNDQGYMQMAEVWFDALSTYLGVVA